MPIQFNVFWRHLPLPYHPFYLLKIFTISIKEILKWLHVLKRALNYVINYVVYPFNSFNLFIHSFVNSSSSNSRMEITFIVHHFMSVCVFAIYSHDTDPGGPFFMYIHVSFDSLCELIPSVHYKYTNWQERDGSHRMLTPSIT